MAGSMSYSVSDSIMMAMADSMTIADSVAEVISIH